MKHDYQAQFQNVRLRPLGKTDIENLRRWRNDPVNTEFLTALPYITEEMQMHWYEEYLQDEDCIVFAIDEMKQLQKMVGSIALYHFSPGKCEYGRFMIGDSGAKGKKVGLHSLLACLHIGFQKLGIEEYYASVHEDNLSARKTDERAGFAVCGSHPIIRGGNELEIIIQKERFYEIHPEMLEVNV